MHSLLNNQRDDEPMMKLVLLLIFTRSFVVNDAVVVRL